MKIYLVSDGAYSDYRIIGAFSSVEKATAARDYYASNEIEEFEVDAPIPDHPPGTYLYAVSMKRDGEVISCDRDTPDDYYTCVVTWIPVESHQNPDGSSRPITFQDDLESRVAYFLFKVWAKSKEGAIKIANERRLQCIAEGDWSGNYQQDKRRFLERQKGKRWSPHYE